MICIAMFKEYKMKIKEVSGLIKSMTGYGKGESADEQYRFKVEMKSVNHRYSDISIRMPRHISYLEEKVKKIMKEKIHRGKVDVYINLEYIDDSSIEVKVDMTLAMAYKEALENIKDELGLSDEVRLNNILNMPEVVKTDKKELDEDLVWNVLKEAVDISVENMVNMRIAEGNELKSDLLDKLQNIEDTVVEIEKRSPTVVKEYKEKLEERINNILDDGITLDEEKLSIEVAFFADKSSIDEELVRLSSHIKQFRSILDEDEPVGRKLDFLIQELNREVNTIGSKANDTEISKDVVNVKSEIEKIREQVQNIE